MDVGDRENPDKDVGDLPIQELKNLPLELQSSEQQLLGQVTEVIGFGPLSEHKLQFAPRRIVDKAIQRERKNYLENGAFESVSIKSLPRDANIISSHHFLQVKKDG